MVLSDEEFDALEALRAVLGAQVGHRGIVPALTLGLVRRAPPPDNGGGMGGAPGIKTPKVKEVKAVWDDDYDEGPSHNEEEGLTAARSKASTEVLLADPMSSAIVFEDEVRRGGGGPRVGREKRSYESLRRAQYLRCLL